MSLWILDTDHVSLFQRGHPAVIEQVAQIALASNSTVVTRNHRDFGQVPDLQLADWTST